MGSLFHSQAGCQALRVGADERRWYCVINGFSTPNTGPRLLARRGVLLHRKPHHGNPHLGIFQAGAHFSVQGGDGNGLKSGG